jgi:DNA-binding transcriptional ArsR family regulator
MTDLDLSELFALVPVRGIVADFLSPPPTTPLPDFAAELDLVRHTPADRVLADLVDVPGVPTAVMDRIRDDPEAAVDRITQTLQTYWDRAFEAHWPRVRTLLEADVLWRSRRLAIGGARALFEDLHATVTWHGDRLSAADPWSYAGSLSGEGLLLVPSAMAWPTVRKMVEPYQPVIAYPARAIATLWETGDQPSSQTLTALLGRTRARLLTVLAEPHSTTALAPLLAITAGAVSQHLSVLRSNGLVTRTRVGGSVLYRRTPRGDALVDPAPQT